MAHMDIEGLAQSIDLAIGNELRAQRLTKGLSREKLAADSGVSAKTIQRFEEAARSPNTKQMAALTSALGIGLRTFLELALKDIEHPTTSPSD
jgi:transcriptional regulator with XRE-family HTH domain